MSLLSGLFGSQKKTDLSFTPPPAASAAPNYGALQNLASQRISAGTTGAETPGVGFGADFVNKSSNPIAQSMQRQFQNVTSPTIQNQYAGKGAGYSSMAANAQALGQGNVDSNIGNLMANFYTLNEQQKKNDITQGIGVGQGLDQSFLNQGNLQSAASERLANATAAQSNYAQQQNNAKAGNLMQAGAMALPGVGGALGSIGGMVGSMGFPGASQLGGLLGNVGQGVSGVGANVLKSNSSGMSTADIIKAIQAGQGGKS